jgi:putative acetyltransferase
MNLRPYQPADLPGVIDVYTASIRTLAAPYYSPEQLVAWAPDQPDVARWEARLAALSLFVAEIDGALAGFSAYTLAGYQDFLYTHPAFARRGVATRLYLQTESVLRAAGVQKITTHASLAARPFFEHHGFQVDVEECVECRGAFLRRFAMHKELRMERL